jgi:macrolide phosphotransferase
MARSPLTLAALATSAVPGLDVIGAAPLPGRTFDSALLAASDRRDWVIRVPRSPEAEARQSAELLALGALTGGIRSRLPFAVASCVGQVAVDGTRAVVTEHLVGEPASLSRLTPGLAAAIGTAVAAIHELPTSCVTEVGLAALGPVHAHQTSGTVVERAGSSGLLPLALRDRWQAALADDQLWQFQPTVVHGGLSAEAVLAQGDTVTAILHWHELRVADPARDLAWLFAGRRNDLADDALSAYLHARPGADRRMAQRATFYSELELAKWLLHGVETKQTDVVDDAVRMLHDLVDDVASDLMNPIGPATAPILAVHDVEALLDRVEKVG